MLHLPLSPTIFYFCIPFPYCFMKRFFLSLLLCCGAMPVVLAQQNHNFSTAQALDIFNTLYRNLDLYYVDTLDAGHVIEAAIGGMIDELDPYTEYYKESESDELRTMTTGKYAGIGSPIIWRKGSDRCVFSSPYEGMPAAKAGVRTGDIIMKIDGEDVPPCGSQSPSDYSADVSSRLRGDVGTLLQLTVKRPGQPHLIDMTIRRENIKRPSVAYSTLLDTSRTDGKPIGYILLDGFTEDTYEDFSAAFRRLKSDGAESLVLDLRGNGGGLLQQAIQVVSSFIPRGQVVVETRGREDNDNRVYKTVSQPLDTEIPLVVLVDYASASASEITSGALQDYDRAVIVGRRTYGKGLVQTPLPLPYNTMAKFTTSKYYIPSGRCVQARDFKRRGEDGQPLHLPDSLCRVFHTQAGRPVKDGGGITPDVVVSHDSLPTMLTYLQFSDGLFDYCVDYRNSHSSIAPPTFFHLTAEEFEAFKDYMVRSGFTYDNRAKKALDYVRRVARQEGYADDAAEEFRALEARLSRNLADDLQRWESEVRLSVESVIVASYYYERGLIAYNLQDDPDLDEAIRILNAPARYRQLLSRP